MREMKSVIVTSTAGLFLAACSGEAVSNSESATTPTQREAALEARGEAPEDKALKQVAVAEARAKERQDASASAERMAWLAGRWTSSSDMSGCEIGIIYRPDGTWMLPNTHSGRYEIIDGKIIHTPTNVERQPWIDDELRSALKRPHTLYFERIDGETMRARLEGKGWHTSYKCP